MEKNRVKKWRILLPAAVFFALAIFLGASFSQIRQPTRMNHDGTNADSTTMADLDLEKSPGSSGKHPNDFSIPLHPDEHIYRPARTIELKWDVTKDRRRPDGVLKNIYLINGEFPGPSIELRSGDRLMITVNNHLQEEGLAFHWHGLRIANQMDGVVGVTQCNIAPDRSFTYAFDIADDQHGTFWYHSHSDIHRSDGLFGPLVVHRPVGPSVAEAEADKFRYDREQVLMVGDWYHRSARDVLESYQDWKNFKIEPAPDSILLNGRGLFECSQATKAQPVDCVSVQVPHLALSSRTRLRVVNTGALTGLSISFAGYEATLIQVDGGHAVEPIRTQNLGVLYPGERVDLVLQRLDEEDPESASFTISLDRENMRFPNLALKETQKFSIALVENEKSRSKSPAMFKERNIAEASWFNLATVHGLNVPHVDPVPNADYSVLLYATISYLTEYEYRPKGFVNRTSWTPSSHASSPLLSLAREDWPHDPEPLVIDTPQEQWVDLVINNLDDKGHPFHLHGHDFYVIATHTPTRTGAFEQYNPFDVGSPAGIDKLGERGALLKDTVYVPSMGYAILRFRADNPGLWLLHCHVLWHEAIGMNAAIRVGEDSNRTVVEAVARTCAG